MTTKIPMTIIRVTMTIMVLCRHLNKFWQHPMGGGGGLRPDWGGVEATTDGLSSSTRSYKVSIDEC